MLFADELAVWPAKRFLKKDTVFKVDLPWETYKDRCQNVSKKAKHGDRMWQGSKPFQTIVWYSLMYFHRRKLWSQTYNNLDRWKMMKSRDGKSKRNEEKRKEDQRRESQKKTKIQVREKVRKSRNIAKHCVVPMICGSGSSKVGSLQWRVRGHLARWEMKNGTPFWREERFPLQL